ncbi:SPOR domain-containing protein [Luteimonas sp. MC1572]|uniref:SPOR domain-containing protein n=1 Tax=Luteimonas sp. MC1572 TaxID=2799325 RepID=UPI0018F0CA85|nr:SPOR domain-containing protein [Luteimonas sp. MC1572]MBJ6981157.1 SPOR domain-containing protein [Luteimonas sp. MC1572]QQO02489.1 SPOR domain-containing protein [Luteimonas sp. MC1572]
MESGLKQRLIGAAVLIALAVIFLPMLVQGPAPDSGVSDLSLQVPSAPGGQYETRDLPLVVPNATTSAGLLADDGSLATVDTATAPTPAGTPSDDAADLSSAQPLVEEDGVVATPLPPPPEPAVTAAVAAAPAATTANTPAQVPAAAAPKPVEAPKPVAAAPAQRLPAATAGGDYVVSFGAYATRADAGAVVDRLRKASLPGYVEETTVNGRDAWRVRIGPYASRADAESARITAGGIGSRAQAQVVALDARPAATVSAKPAATASAPAKPAASTPSAAAPTPAPAATPPAAAGTGFAVQLGAFGNAADAQALRDRLRAAGIGAFTDTVQTDKGALTRVKAGPVLTRAEAEQLKARIKSSQGIDGLVRAHP